MTKTTFLMGVFLLVNLSCFSQEKVIYDDTTYFIPHNNNFNLLMSASKADLNNVVNLIMRGADVNTVSVDGITPLMYAAENGDLEIIRILIEAGAKPNLKPYNGVTALISAVKQDFLFVAEYLLNHGADINTADNLGITALHYAASYNLSSMLKMLLFYEANPDLPDNNGNTPLISAVYSNSPETVKILINQGIDINNTDKKGYTALSTSVSRENHQITEFLIESGADINIINKGGMTALAIAIHKGDIKTARLLISHGADINHKIRKSQTLLEYSQQNNQQEISSLLKNSGAVPSYLPDYNQFGAGLSLQGNTDDFQLGLTGSLIDSKYNTSLSTSLYFRPVAVRILTKAVNDTLFQYWERRYSFSMGFEKKLMLINTPGNIRSGPYAEINGLYTFGGYRGSNQHPDPQLLASPRLGWFIMTKKMSVNIGYQYLKLSQKNINPHRFNLGILFFINRTNKNLLEKNIEWLNYE